MHVSQNWCPLFPAECPHGSAAAQLDSCETKATGDVACTLDRVGAPRPVANGVVVRRGARGAREFLLIKRRRGLATQPGKWGLPGGGLRANESPGEAVCREVLEETGVHVELVGVFTIENDAVQLLNETMPFVVRPGTDCWDEPNAYVGLFLECRPVEDAPIGEPNDPNVAESQWFAERDLAELMSREEVTPLDTTVLRHHYGVGTRFGRSSQSEPRPSGSE